MLRKHRQIEVPDDNPLANDRLQRKKSVETLSGLIANAQTPFVLAVTGPWGAGKTTFVKMLEATLRKQDHVCIHHNAWESDFADDPLVGLIEEIGRAITNAAVPEHAAASVKGRIRQTKSRAKDLLHAAGPILLQVATRGALTSDVMKHFAEIVASSGDDIAKALSKYAEESLSRYRQAKESIGNLHDQLAELVRQISTPEARRKTPLVFVIDELDRCRPTYAIQLLERVKHIFDVPGIVFVLAIDQKQLCHSIQSVYGLNFDAKGYLRRFIDVAYELDTVSLEAFVYSIWEAMGLEEVCRGLSVVEGGKSAFASDFCPIARAFGSSLREIEHVMSQVNVILRLASKDRWADLHQLGIVTALRMTVPESLEDFVHCRLSADKLLAKIRETPTGRGWLEQRKSVDFEAFLFAWSRVEDEKQKKIAELEYARTVRATTAPETSAVGPADRDSVLLNAIRSITDYFTPSGIDTLQHHLGLFQLAEGFSSVK